MTKDSPIRRMTGIALLCLLPLAAAEEAPRPQDLEKVVREQGEMIEKLKDEVQRMKNESSALLEKDVEQYLAATEPETRERLPGSVGGGMWGQRVRLGGYVTTQFRDNGDGTNVEFDFLSVVTHETGHFLGLSHSQDTDATMFASYQQHEIDLRTLAADDIAGICAIYPPGDTPDTCEPTVRHGFSDLCADEQSGPETLGGCCTVAAGSSGGAGGAAIAGAFALALLAARRAPRRPRGR